MSRGSSDRDIFESVVLLGIVRHRCPMYSLDLTHIARSSRRDSSTPLTEFGEFLA